MDADATPACIDRPLERDQTIGWEKEKNIEMYNNFLGYMARGRLGGSVDGLVIVLLIVKRPCGCSLSIKKELKYLKGIMNVISISASIH